MKKMLFRNASRNMLMCICLLRFPDKQLDELQSCTILVTIILVVLINTVLVIRDSYKTS